MSTSPEPQGDTIYRKMEHTKQAKEYFESTSLSSSPWRSFPSPLAKSGQTPVGYKRHFQSSCEASSYNLGGQESVGIGTGNKSSQKKQYYHTADDRRFHIDYLSKDTMKTRSTTVPKPTNAKCTGLEKRWGSLQQQDVVNLRAKIQHHQRSRSPWQSPLQEPTWRNSSCELSATQKLDKMLHRIRSIATSPRRAPSRDPILEEFLRKRRSKQSIYLRESKFPVKSKVYPRGGLQTRTGSPILHDFNAASTGNFDKLGVLSSSPSKSMSPFPHTWGGSRLQPVWHTRQASPAYPRDKGSFIQRNKVLS